MSNITKLRSTIIGLARPNIYNFYAFPPSGVPTIDYEKLNFLCKSAILPSVSLKMIPIQRMGWKLEIPGDIEFGDAQFTFAVDEEFKVRQFFIDWVNWACEFDKGTFIRKPPSEVLDGSISIACVKPQDFSEIYSYRLENAFPKLVSEINLPSDEENSFQTFTVSFGYSYMWQEI